MVGRSAFVVGKGRVDLLGAYTLGTATPEPAAGTALVSSNLESATVASPISNADMWSFVGATYGGTANFAYTSVVSTTGPSGATSKVLNQRLAAGTFGMPGGDGAGTGIALTSTPLSAPLEEATIEFDIRFVGSGTWPLGGKIPGLGGYSSAGTNSVPTGGDPSPYGWSGRMMFRRNNAAPTVSANLVGYVYDPTQAVDVYGQDRATGKLLTWGTWFHIKQYYKMNTVSSEGTGVADGIHRIYVDGVQCYESLTQVYRKYQAAKITHLVWDNFCGGNDATWAPAADLNVQFDNLLITAGATTTTPAADTTAPTVPSNLTMTSSTTTTLTFSWTASTDAVGVTGYTIHQDGVTVATTTGATTVTLTGLTAGTAYEVRVAARDAAGNFSTFTLPQTFTTAAATVAADLTDAFTGTTGAAPDSTRWTVTPAAGVGTATIQANQLRLTSGAAPYAIGPYLYASGSTARQDSEVLIDYTVANPNVQTYPCIGLRSTGAAWPDGNDAGSPSNGYYIQIQPTSNTFSVVQGYNAAILVSQAFTWTAGSTYRIRFRLLGSDAFVKVWLASGTEPTAWTWTGTGLATEQTAGKLFLTFANGPASTAGTATYDNVTVTNLGTVNGTTPGIGVTTMPTGDYTDTTSGTVWTSVFAEDFDTAVVGGAANWDPGNQGTLPAANFYSGRINCYERPISSTSGLSLYYTARTTSVSGSAFKINMHSESVPETGAVTALGGTLIPVLPSYYSKFIRAQWRFRVTNKVNNGSIYGLVWQQINSPNWPAYGEHDYPEGDVSGPIEGNFHPSTNVTGGSGDSHQNYSPSPAQAYDDWHTYTSQWEPTATTGVSRLRWWVDDILVMDRTNGVGNQPMVFMLQAADNGAVPAASTVAEIQVDWIKLWKHPSGTV